MTIKDYRGHARGPCSRNSSSPNDKNLERCFPGPSAGPQICKTPRPEGTSRLFCITGTRNCPRSRQLYRHSGLEACFQKLSQKAISPYRATTGSVGYDLFMPINFLIQPKEQKTIFVDIAIKPPEGYYAQLMSKSGLKVLYKLEVKAGVIDPDFTGNIGVVLQNNSDQPFTRAAGEQIAKLLFVKIATPTLVQVTSLAETQRGEYGFGAHTN